MVSTPNCMPNYQSVMSYLYQTRGLTGANGLEFVDYSSGGPGFLENAPPTPGAVAIPRPILHSVQRERQFGGPGGKTALRRDHDIRQRTA